MSIGEDHYLFLNNIGKFLHMVELGSQLGISSVNIIQDSQTVQNIGN